jgi:hypothetical protein
MSDKQVEADVASKLPTAIDVHGVNFACFVAGSTFIVFLQHSHLQFLDVSADSASTGGGGDDDDAAVGGGVGGGGGDAAVGGGGDAAV